MELVRRRTLANEALAAGPLTYPAADGVKGLTTNAEFLLATPEAVLTPTWPIGGARSCTGLTPPRGDS
jgi:hypothetical protein